MRSLTGTLSALCIITSAALAEKCRCFPGDVCWPAEAEWDGFNATVGGSLIRTVPIGSVCHDPQYDAEACAAVQASWTDPALQ